MKPRKLLTPDTLQQLASKTDAGVPLTLAMRQLGIADSVTRPVVAKLLSIYPDHKESLFPPWLHPDGPAVQSQPEHYNYKGYFPLGEWIKCRTSNRS